MSTQKYRDSETGRLRRRRLRRGRRSHRAGVGAGRTLGGGVRAGPAAARRRTSSTMSSSIGTSAASPTMPSGIRRRSATIRRRRPSCRSSSRPSGTGARSAARACTTRRTTGASTRSISTSAACSAPIPGTGFADWPITYADLEPYYTKVEWEIGVSGLAGASPVRSAAHQALSDAAAAGEVVRRAVRARRAQAGPASGSGADGDQLAAVPRPAGVRALRLLPRLRVRGDGEGVDADDRHSGSGGDRPLRSAARQLRRRASRPTSRDARPASPTSIANGASVFRRRVPWWCAPTAPRRRGCC